MTTQQNSNDESKKYKLEAIYNSAVYLKKLVGHLSELYYLISWKNYPKKTNTWELSLAVEYLRKFIWLFYKDNPDRLTTTSAEAVDTAPLIARLLIKLKDKTATGLQDKSEVNQPIATLSAIDSLPMAKCFNYQASWANTIYYQM